MPEHRYKRSKLIDVFEDIVGKTLEEIDKAGMFEHMKNKGFKLQKGVAGAVIEQSVLGYNSDTKQEADLIVEDGDSEQNVELKVTGMLVSDSGGEHYIAKEPMSITAVGIYDLADQTFEESHFWAKLEHMLIVYYQYLYANNNEVTPYDYKDFPIRGYEFHEFSDEDKETLRRDWNYVFNLICSIVANHPGNKDKEWKNAVKQEYIERHGILRSQLSYIDLAPKFPPRFRLKKPVVNTMISNHFGYELEQLPGRYNEVSDVEKECKRLTKKFSGKTIAELADMFGVPKLTEDGKENKGIAEQIVVKMFGGNSKKLNRIELFRRFGLIGKSIVVTPKRTRTEDMKLFKLNFEEICRTSVIDEESGNERAVIFEDSDIYSYFADHEFLLIVFEEPEKEYYKDQETGKRKEVKHPLSMNKFLGFKRLVFSDELIDKSARKLWEDTRDKITNKKLKLVPTLDSNGKQVINKNGSKKESPNFIKSSDNTIFIRGGATDTSDKYKTEIINGLKMIPQYAWIRGSFICNELKNL